MRGPRTLLIALGVMMAGVAIALYFYLNRGPHDFSYVLITHDYHVCEKCGGLDGGIYGKGPHKRLRTASGYWCMHHWRSISRAEFKEQSAARFGVDWSREIPFWSED